MVPQVGLQFVIVLFPGHTHLLFMADEEIMPHKLHQILPHVKLRIMSIISIYHLIRMACLPDIIGRA